MIPSPPLSVRFLERQAGDFHLDDGRTAPAFAKCAKGLVISSAELLSSTKSILASADAPLKPCYLIEEKSSADRTRTAVRLITGEERTEEVARMPSGAKLTETSRKHAEQMLKTNA